MRDMRQLAASGFQPQVRCIIDTPERLVGGRLIALRIVSNLVVVDIFISQVDSVPKFSAVANIQFSYSLVL